MAWIESHQSLANHRKTIALSRILDIPRPQAIGHLHLLWWWCLDNAPNGDLSDIDPRDISRAIMWEGDIPKLITALVAAQFLNPDMTVHGWDEYAEKLITRRSENARRNRELRLKRRKLAVSSVECQRDTHESITRLSRDGATVPNSTVPIINPVVPLPEWLKRETWDAFLEMRKTIKAKPTPRAVALILKELSDLKAAGDDPNKVLEQSIMNNWKGVFALKGGNHGTNQGHSQTRGTKLPNRNTGYTPAPPDPALDALVAAQRDGGAAKH